MKPLFLTSILGVLSLASSQATVSFQYQLGWSPGVNPGTVGVLVVDTLGDGFAPVVAGDDYNVGSFFGADDLIIHRTTAFDIGLGGPLGFQDSVNSLAIDDLTPAGMAPAGIDTGDELLFLWIDGAPTEPAQLGQTYGSFRTDAFDASSGANGPFIIPADGSAIRLFAFSDTFTGDGASVPDSAFLANNAVVIPEPSVGILFALGGFLCGLRRKR